MGRVITIESLFVPNSKRMKILAMLFLNCRNPNTLQQTTLRQRIMDLPDDIREKLAELELELSEGDNMISYSVPICIPIDICISLLTMHSVIYIYNIIIHTCICWYMRTNCT